MFNYQSRTWGTTEISQSLIYLQALKLKYILNDLKPVQGKILDIGCGGGNIVKAIKKSRPDLEIWGVDVSKKTIDQAKKSSPEISFQVAEATKLPFPNNFFDAVLMFDLLEHLKSPEAGLNEAKRVLKKDGLFHIFLPLEKQPFTLYYLFYKLTGWQAKRNQVGHIVFFSHSEFEKLVQEVGFKIIKKRFSFHLILSIFDILYFNILDIFKVKITTSIEGALSKKRANFIFFIFNLFYRLIIFLGNLESSLLYFLPGGGGHYTLIKI